MQTGLDHLTTGSLLQGTVSLWEQIGSRGKASSAVSCIQIKCRSRILSIKRATAACELTWMKLLMSEIGATQGDPIDYAL